MQVTNNYQTGYQPKFGEVKIMKMLSESIAKGEVNKKKLTQIDSFKKQFADSNVTILLDKIGADSNRLDAQIYCGKMGDDIYFRTYKWLGEKKYLNLFGLSSKEFFCRLSRKVHHIENKFAPKNP